MVMRTFTQDGALIVPNGPKCLKCHHPPCPICKDYCDLNLDDGMCDCECEYDVMQYREWLRLLESLNIELAPEGLQQQDIDPCEVLTAEHSIFECFNIELCDRHGCRTRA